jgi:glucose/arabinose dehydrogenase/mono/diheme cytochrome c family protein
MRSFVIFLVELLLVVSSIFIADALQSSVNFIPSWLIKFPQVDYMGDDFRTVLLVFVLVLGATFIVLRRIYGPWDFDNAGRTTEELFGLAAGFAISTIILFVTTSISFDPNFIVGIALIGTGLIVTLHVVFSLANSESRKSIPLALFSRIFKRIFTVSGVIILCMALSPGLLAKLFVSDRDFANSVTQIRIYFSQKDNLQYGFVNALGDKKFLQPMLARLDPGNPSRLYVLERAGRLVAVDYPQGDNEKTVLDFRDKVGYVESENGALGFAFHPNFGDPSSPYEQDIFIYFTAVNNDKQSNHLSRFSIASDGHVRDIDSEQPLLVLPREKSGFHNGGSIEFGPDRLLYVALGEGVHPKGIKQQSETLRGGILRLDIDCKGDLFSRPITQTLAQGSQENYCIPLDNPFTNITTVMDEYWAIGLRNPFRMSFDSKTGLLWAGDVGSTTWEEVNIIRAGGHYQYPYYSGEKAGKKKKPFNLPGTEVGPVYAYAHTAYDRAVIGGFVYQGSQFPELKNKYLFADNYSSRVFLMPSGGDPVERVEHIATANQYAQRGTSSLVQFSEGTVIATTLGRTAVATGEIVKMVLIENAETPSQEPDPEEVYSTQEIKELYVSNCARCHGYDGSGDGPDAELLNIALPDFTRNTPPPFTSDEKLRKVIVDGGYAVGMSPLMPAWGHLLGEGEVDGLVEFLKTFRPSDQ